MYVPKKTIELLKFLKTSISYRINFPTDTFSNLLFTHLKIDPGLPQRMS